MSGPIRLWDCEGLVNNNDSTIKKSVLPPSYAPGPYEAHARSSAAQGLSYVPSLAFFCVKALTGVVDQLHLLGNLRFRYKPPEAEGSYDLLRALLPSYGSEDFDFARIDPRLWAALIQLYDNLPEDFRTYYIPLSDIHVPLLQSIPSTPDFSLITLLSLSGCRHLTDTTVLELKYLHNLVGLDASRTRISSHGILSLSQTLQWSVDDTTGLKRRRGPWPLRLLRLNQCRNVTNRVLPCLTSFPLLSFVDLRDTRCYSISGKTGPFGPCKDKKLRTAVLSENLATLAKHFSDARSSEASESSMFSSKNIYTLDIMAMDHIAATPTAPRQPIYTISGPRSSQEGFWASSSLRLRGGVAESQEDDDDIDGDSSSDGRTNDDSGDSDDEPRHDVEEDLAACRKDDRDYPGHFGSVDVHHWQDDLIARVEQERHENELREERREYGMAQDISRSYRASRRTVSYTEGFSQFALSRHIMRSASSNETSSRWHEEYSRVAEKERYAESSRRVVQNFYSASTSRYPLRPSRMHEISRYGFDDSEYMLYRTPPPWSVLDELFSDDNIENVPGISSSSRKPRRAVVPTKTILDDAVFSNRGDKKAKMALNSVQELLIRRRVKQFEGISNIATGTMAAAKARNPFRKMPTFAEGIEKLGRKAAPVSTLKVPVLPSPPEPYPPKKRQRQLPVEKQPSGQRKSMSDTSSRRASQVETDGPKPKQFDWGAWSKSRKSI